MSGRTGTAIPVHVCVWKVGCGGGVGVACDHILGDRHHLMCL